MERKIKFGLKIASVMLALFGVRYLLALFGILLPLEWFLIMFFGMLGIYGVILLVIYIIYITFG